MTSPYQTPDETVRAQARELLMQAQFAALAVLHPQTGLPTLSRIALATDTDGCPVTLISSLAEHTQALNANPNCALLVGEPEEKGDPLTHPRLTLHAVAQWVNRDMPEYALLRERYLSLRPKAKLYIDFADFSFVRFTIQDGLQNGGFGKAYRLTASDF
ncbi:pyridoxamine 5'-phosphate oxidase family protein [Ruegeria sp. HKCCD9179]|uniref:HugZ family pyridoxamine 5'-phosphate oxidase n=1 Tax=unclassified Ruegeria TaxID=2625375 RepID=UPI001487C16F|nr:pyridoxamine 5-phosphate oxidase [Ruegeria sp. HKCCD6109]